MHRHADTVAPMRDHEPSPGHTERRLTTKEAAELLGVKPETVYAYVSRGQLSSRRVPGGRGSTFDAKEVETLSRRNRRESGGRPGSGGELSLRTPLTVIHPGRYYFPGGDAPAPAAPQRAPRAPPLPTGGRRPPRGRPPPLRGRARGGAGARPQPPARPPPRPGRRRRGARRRVYRAPRHPDGEGPRFELQPPA